MFETVFAVTAELEMETDFSQGEREAMLDLLPYCVQSGMSMTPSAPESVALVMPQLGWATDVSFQICESRALYRAMRARHDAVERAALNLLDPGSV